MLTSYSIEATDGKIGHVDSFLFDDHSWTVRYLVVDTGNWLPGRKVLLTPLVLEQPDGLMNSFPVKLTKEQIKNSPDIDTDKPVSRQREIELHQYYGWSPYWITGINPIAAPLKPVIPPKDNKHREKLQEISENLSGSNRHLRSSTEVAGYKIHASDGQIGHVEDFIADNEKWVIRYIMVDTRNWLPGKKVIISPKWINEINWTDSRVTVDVKIEKIKNSPEYNPEVPVNRNYESQLYEYYGWPPYWI